ncbi:MAG: cytochrome P450 [Pseudomonadota bacterium]
MTWSPFRPDIIKDPANGHQSLLGECPVHRCEEFDPAFYTLSRYEDVADALKNHTTFSSHFGQGPRFSEPQGMLCDPPVHTHLRRIVQKAFSPRAMAQLRPQVEHLSQQLIREIKERPEQEFDLHDDFAFPLPVIIIAGMLGVPEQDLNQFKVWSDIQVAAMGAEDPTIYAKDQAAFLSYLQQQFLARREALNIQQEVPDDLLTLIAGARDLQDEPLSQADALSMLSQLLVGGNETTTSLITNVVWRLLQQPELWERLVDNPDLIEVAIEESLRFDPPVLGLYRNTTHSVTLHGETIPEKCKVYLYYAAANRDASVFETPDEFNLDRPKKRHLSFGSGLHFCLGAPMARMEAEIALRHLLEALPGLTLQSDGDRIPPFFLWGRKTLPVAWS